MLLSMVHHMCYIEFPFQCMYIYNLAAFFNIHSGGANAPPALRFAPPVRLFLPPEKVPFYKKYSLLFIGRNKTQRFLMWHNMNLPFLRDLPHQWSFLKKGLAWCMLLSMVHHMYLPYNACWYIDNLPEIIKYNLLVLYYKKMSHCNPYKYTAVDSCMKTIIILYSN